MGFPKNNPNWSGEGSPDELCQAALDYLKKNEQNWGDAYEDDLGPPIAASLAGSKWKVCERNILKEPVQYRLDFKIAFSSKSGSRFAYVFHYSFYTEKKKGVAKAPPFTYCNPHQYAHYKILANRVPGSSSSSTTSGAGRIFWLALAAANIVAGLLAAAPVINKKLPQLATLYAKLTPLRNLLGVVALAIGILCFLRTTLLHFAPHADILPQLSAIVAGLFLGKELLLKKSELAEQAETSTGEAAAGTGEAAAGTGEAAEGEASAAADGEAKENAAPGGEKVEAAMEAAGDAADAAGEAAEKAASAAQNLLIQHKEKIERLEQHQVPVGYTCIVLGVLHLLMGCYPLV